MQKILITRRLQPIAKELLCKRFHVDESLLDGPMPKEELKRAMGEYDGILSTLVDKIDAEVLMGVGRVKVISNCAAGLDNIDVELARKKNIAIFNLPDIVTNSTADLTFALFLSFVRKVGEGQKYVREGRWRGWEPDLFLGEELNEKTFGIIGYGKIGKAVAKRAIGFGMKVAIVHRSHVDLHDPHMRQVSLDVLCKEADYISIHVPLNKETYQMINLSLMKKMEKRPVLINMARGSIIKTDDLVQALEEGLVRGAALDVTDPEPISASHPLCHLDNCFIIPHIGSATVECRTLMAKKAAENLAGFFHDQ